jgi:C1A family cysteine protease
MTDRKYGWKPSKKDHRDYKLRTVNPSVYDSLPRSVDLRSIVPEVLDQGNLGSCTAHALTMAQRIARIKQGLPDTRLSRLFVYYNERLIEGTVNEDDGAEIKDGAKVLGTYGVPPETDWPYIENQFTIKPSDQAYKDAIQDEANKYMIVEQTENEIKLCLSEGYPVVFGATLFSEFEGEEVARTGIVPMPTDASDQVGGHAILIIGYDDNTKRFTVLNSWGNGWGDKGYCYFPYEYITNANLCSDFWTIRTVSPGDPNRKIEMP